MRIYCPDTGEVLFSYRSYLKSRHWFLFKKRYDSSEFYSGVCYICGRISSLHHHHIYYDRLGSELYEDICLLCGLCHRNVHRSLRKGVSWDSIVDRVNNAR